MKLTREERRQLRYKETHKVIDGVDCKFCKSCNGWFPSEGSFYKNKTNKTDGLSTYCRECIKTRNSKWSRENRDLVREYHNKYNSTPKRKLVYKKFNDKEETKNKYSQWRRDNTDKIKAYQYKRSEHKKHEITKEEWIECKEYFNNSCAYCGLHSDNHYRSWNGEFKKMDLHKEHVNHEGSNKLDNCVPSCQSCNSSKYVYSLEEWYTKDNQNFNEARFNKIHNWLFEDYKLHIK